MNKFIISDTSCLIALDRIDHLYILQKIFSIIYITQKVKEEFERPLPDWIIVESVIDQDQVKKLELILDPGEASSITLALESENAILIIDEKKGRKVAQDLNIHIIGTLKVLLIAKQKGVIASVKQIIQLLNSQSFRFNKALVDEILLQAKEI